MTRGTYDAPKHFQHSGEASSRRGVVPLALLLSVLLACVACGVWYLLSACQANARDVQSLAEIREAVVQEDTLTASEATTDETDEEVELVENPIDFDALTAINPDIYAWLSIPDTGIDLPILQSATDDAFYLTHSVDGSYDVYGAVFTEAANAQDFSDSVTMIYGHNGENQLRNIHYFADEEFFAEHETFTVYTPGHILTYRVISAYKFDNRHILNSYDFADPEVRLQYFAFVSNPESEQVNVRDDIEPLTEDDRIIQLSTCMLDEFHGPHRFLVTGVLVDDQPTF